MIARENGYGLAKPALKYWVTGAMLVSIIGLYASFAQSATVADYRFWTRVTAQISFIYFILSYAAAPFYQLSQNPLFDFLRRHRRNSGLGFAFTHSVHLIALILYMQRSDETLSLTVWIGGGGLYVLMYLMAFTSNDAAIRRLGLKKWRIVHTIGAHVLAFVFFVSFMGKAMTEPVEIKYYGFLGAITAIIALRIIQFGAVLIRRI